MGIQIDWLDKDAGIGLWRFDGLWTWDEFNTQAARAMSEAEALPYRVDLVVDVSMNLLPPFGFIHNFRSGAVIPRAKNHGISVIVGGRMVEMILRLLFHINPALEKVNFFAPSLEEALLIIHTHRAQSTQQAPTAKDIPAAPPTV
ncbi:MAG: hypothetical protein HXY40_18950 [Chloroflexi bacterium]|nr:hypothetical protein [Chloroflexota bacterium]